MSYSIYKLTFPHGVHLGKRRLEDGVMTFHADTLFSALCQESLKLGGSDLLEMLVSETRKGNLLLSDAFPYVGETLFLPKPFIHIRGKDDQGNSSVKKMFKKMTFLPSDTLDAFLKGEFPLERADDLAGFGRSEMKVSASVRGLEETMPYRVQTFTYGEGNGLYIIVGMPNGETAVPFRELMESLSYSGIGGKRSAGLGKFAVTQTGLPEELGKRMNGSKQVDHGSGNGQKLWMTLTAALPADDELDDVMNGASYKVLRRGGFVASGTYADEYMRKRDLYLFDAGSCFHRTFGGDVYDVAGGGRHPVYRYAKPIMMEIGR